MIRRRAIIRSTLLTTLMIIFLFVFSRGFYAKFCHSTSIDGLAQISNSEISKLKSRENRPFLPILMPACSRANYMQEVLDNLDKCHGIQNAILVISQDCNDGEVTRLISDFKARTKLQGVVHLRHIPPYFGMPSLIVSNEYKTTANVKFLLDFAFDYLKADGAIILEADLVPSIDFYEYHKWAFVNILDNPAYSNVMNINSFNIASVSSSDPYILKEDGFVVWGWSTSARIWNKYMRNRWSGLNNWDINVQYHIRIPNNLISFTPALSRVKNIGQKGINFNVDDGNWERTFQKVYIEEERQIFYAEKKPLIRKQ